MYIQDTFRLTLLIIILSVVGLIFTTLMATSLRRIVQSKKYKKLDRQRRFYRDKLRSALDKGKVSQNMNEFISSPRSIKFQAIEDVLFDLIEERKSTGDIKKLFKRFGYITHYEKKLESRDIITRASAIDKLGRMSSESSADKLINMLKSENPEIISVTVRALGNIGYLKGLRSILEILPSIYEKWLITRRTLGTSILKFGQPAVPMLLDYLKKTTNTKIIAIILDVLSHLYDKNSLPFALCYLEHEDAEVRAKALKVIETTANGTEDSTKAKIIPLLDDPVWFVRLQAVKAIGSVRYKKAVDTLGALLFDENWQVRNAAATSLTKFEANSIDIFLRALKQKDVYAKQSICEELEKTNFISRLIENLNSDSKEIYEKSKEILKIMHSLNFSTPLFEYLKRVENGKIKDEINFILGKDTKA
ncbi:MAG: HEAT repeat domain-containing protein [Nitrospirota bacterium]